MRLLGIWTRAALGPRGKSLPDVSLHAGTAVRMVRQFLEVIAVAEPSSRRTVENDKHVEPVS